MEGAKSVAKTFALLEFIAMRDGLPVTPSEAAAALALPQPTCARLFRQLLELGYLTQNGRRRGYTLGPVVRWLGEHEFPDRQLKELAIPRIARIAGNLRICIQLLIRHGAFRQVLCQCDASHRPDAEIVRRGGIPRNFRLLDTVSGRMLLAHAPEDELRTILRAQTWETPGGVAPVWRNAAEALAGLRSIRDLPYLDGVYRAEPERKALAVPIMRFGNCRAVLAAVWTPADTAVSGREIIVETRRAAAELERALAGNASVEI